MHFNLEFYKSSIMRVLCFLIFSHAISPLFAQDHNEEPKKLVYYFSNGHFTGQIRDYTMTTVNAGSLRDYYANAIGASIHYETLPFKGVSVGLNGIFVYRAFSNDLLAIDSIANSNSRYEIQLFDVEHQGNYTDLDRLEELYLKYETKKINLMYGKMEVESPLVRLHDGRMKPKVFSGFKIEAHHKSHLLTGAWFNKSSPRSTTHWYTISEAIGLYHNGFDANGQLADYHEQVSSNGLGILGFELNPKPTIQLNLWNYYLDNISNSSLIKLDADRDTGLYVGLLYLFQTPVNNGGNNTNQFYHPNTEQTNLSSARMGYHFRFCDIQSNFTHIFNSGRYLFPREFGVDPSYTYLPRNQLEGLGNANSFGISGLKKVKDFEIKLDWNRTITDDRALFNKYLQHSYDQINLDCTYSFENKLDGLDLRFLYIYRRALDNDIPLSDQINSLNFIQLNLVANFNFAASLNSEHPDHK